MTARGRLIPFRLPAITLRLGLVVALGMAALALAAERTEAETGSSVQIGVSEEGRPIEITCFASGAAAADDEVVLVIGAIHAGTEAVTADLARELIGDFQSDRLPIPDDLIVCVLPALNPDGLVLGVHTNASRVDLNRNWPSPDWTEDAWHPETGPVSGGHRPLSEAETRVLHDFLEMTTPSAVIVLHCCGSLVEANSQADAVFMAHRYARAAGFAYLGKWDFYDISGEFIDAMDALRIPAMDVELARRDDTGLEDHRAGLRAALDYIAERPE